MHFLNLHGAGTQQQEGEDDPNLVPFGISEPFSSIGFAELSPIFSPSSHNICQNCQDCTKKSQNGLVCISYFFPAALMSETGALILLCAYMSHGTGLASALEKLHG